MRSKQVSFTVCQKMSDRIEELVESGLYSDRQDMIVSAIRNHRHSLLESAAECMMFHGHLRNGSGDLTPADGSDRAGGQLAKFVTCSFDGSGLLDVYEYNYPGQDLDVRINVRIPENLLDAWSTFAPYSGHRRTVSNYIRDCIVMELIRIDEDERLLASVRMLKDGSHSPREMKEMDGDISKILEGRHGYIFSHCERIAFDR